MRSILLYLTCMLAFALPASAQEYHLGDALVDPAETVDFNGITENPGPVLVNGLTSSMSYLLSTFTEAGGNNIWVFEMTVSNTSTAPITSANLTSVGFNVAGLDGTVALSEDGVYFSEVDLDGHFPVGIGNLDVCVTGDNGNCTGGGSGIAMGESDTFYLMITMSDTIDSFILGDFAVRYQGIYGDGYDGTSGVGLVTTIPEPATWLMMIIGFGIVSASARRSKRHTSVARA